MINDASSAAQSHRALEWRHDGGLCVAALPAAGPFESLLSTIATRVIDAVEQGDLRLIMVCSRADCNMFYFRHHHRRRYCNERCANADRQVRYNRRKPREAGLMK